MVKRFFLIGFVLLSITTGFSSASDYKKNWEDFEAFTLTITSDIALRKGRLIIEITKRGQVYSASLTDQWNDSKRKLIPKSGWQAFCSKLEEYEVLYLPGSHGLQHREDISLSTDGKLWVGGTLDGGKYYIQYRFRADKGFSRKYTYENPCSYNRDDATKLCKIIGYIKNELGILEF